MPEKKLIGIALGEAPMVQVEAAVARRFGAAHVEWLDRRELRRRPLATLLRLWRRRYAAALLVAPDLRQTRLRLTSLALGLPRTELRWRLDLLGQCQTFSMGHHLKRNTWPIARHVVAMVLALVTGAPLLSLLDWYLGRQAHSTGRAYKRPRRVLYLRSQLWLGLQGGGSVAHTAGVIDGLRQAGVDVQVVSSDRLPGVSTPTDIQPPETWFDDWLRELEELAYNVAFFLTALGAARRTRPHVIYQRHTAFTCCGALLSRLLGIPLVLEFNSSELWKGKYWGGLRLRRQAALVERINLRAADRVVVVSRVLRDELCRAGAPSHKLVVNPNAVDAATFSPAIDGSTVRERYGLEPSKHVVVGFSGTFGMWHGIPTLAAVLSRVLAARPQVRWLLIGDGPLRPLIGETIDRYRLEPESVVQPGLVPHQEMPAYLAACDILVSPHGRQADGKEFFGSPTKLFEYMAAGRPIVASAVGQISEVLRDEESALLVPPDDPEALCHAIVRLVDDPCVRRRLALAARADAEAHHTWRQNADRVLASLGEGEPAWSR